MLIIDKNKKKSIDEVLNYIDACLNSSNNQSDRGFVVYMLKKKTEALKLKILISMDIIIKKHC